MAAYATYPSLKGRSVLVTGGGSGIGAAIVAAFAEQGSRVAFIDFDRDASEATVAEIEGRGFVKPLFLEADLRDIEALRGAVRQAAETNGPITALINNAARDDRHRLEDVTPEYWDDRQAMNIRHQFFAAQAVYPMMKEAGGGSIVNMGSVSWMVGQGGMPGYTTAKSAVMGLTRGLARDMGPDNVRVNSVAPGWIMTRRQIDMWLNEESEKELMQRQCLKRKLQPDEIARVVLFFASDDSGCMTNQTYVADGGWV
ncbi:MAG: SDR family oxidoreductase [Geminicoccaceae bacterium]|nr:SDR family oxidoreductase [Geminicoccaceae bacterium]